METEHFLNFKKSFEIIFPWDVDPFIIKTKVSLPMIESSLKETVFLTEVAIPVTLFQSKIGSEKETL